MIYFFELISKKAISGKDIDALIEHFQANNDVHVVAALLEYKESHQNKVGKIPESRLNCQIPNLVLQIGENCSNSSIQIVKLKSSDA